jgi:hypothetical protein
VTLGIGARTVKNIPNQIMNKNGILIKKDQKLVNSTIDVGRKKERENAQHSQFWFRFMMESLRNEPKYDC